MLQDLRYGVRVLFKSRMLTLVAVVSLSLGIGATSTIYALLDQLLIHDVTAREPERLVSLDGSWCSYPNYRDIRESGVFAEIAANAECYPHPLWREHDQTHPISAVCVSGNFFEVMGVQAARGRVFTHDEAAAEKNPRVVVISHQFWQQRLGSDPDVIGRLFTINRTGYTIIGVLPAGYRGKYGRPPEIVVPLSTDLYPRLFERDSATMGYTGRLAPGRTIPQTQQALLAVLRGLERQFPDKIKLKQEPVPELKPAVGIAKFGKKSWDFKFSAILGTIAVLVLLIACANVTGLLLARGVARQREIATRLAVGATKLRLIRQLLVETALVAGAGTATGIGIAFLTADILRNGSLRGEAIHFEFTPDWRFAGAAAALGVIATFVSGIVPALVSSRINLANAVRASQNTTPRLRLRFVLVSVQLACSVILLFGAFVLVVNLVHVLRFDPGFDAAHTLQFDVTTTDPKIYPVALREKVFRELEAQPGVEAVSWAWYMPFNFSYGENHLRRADAPDAPAFRVTTQGIDPGYLKTMRIALLAGRELDWSDVKPRDKALPVPALINLAFARRYFPDRNPVGERLIGGLSPGDASQIEIIGISANTSFFRSPGEEPKPLLQPLSNLRHIFIARVSGSPAVEGPELANFIERHVPGAAVGYFTGLERLDQGIRATRVTTILLGVLAFLGLILALIGLCGISIYNVARRTPEIGIRMAMGATPGQVLRLMLREGLTLVAAGALLGLAGTLALARLLSGFLAAGINPLEPLAFVAVLATLMVAAAASIYFPSRRAARVDPLVTLRHE